MRQHHTRPLSPQNGPASPTKAPALCTKRGEPDICSIYSKDLAFNVYPLSSPRRAANAVWPTGLRWRYRVVLSAAPAPAS